MTSTTPVRAAAGQEMRLTASWRRAAGDDRALSGLSSWVLDLASSQSGLGGGSRGRDPPEC
eukprot:10726882-Alexandrium_andersonii.AAC.1